ncbi:MAG: efflux RND transporter periplasmic adaptor subunit [Phycisphaerales bacterium]|nr:efflux RND transporter periplasmic adaptor subunit [Phycisphaerales bacterium]
MKALNFHAVALLIWIAPLSCTRRPQANENPPSAKASHAGDRAGAQVAETDHAHEGHAHEDAAAEPAHDPAGHAHEAATAESSHEHGESEPAPSGHVDEIKLTAEAVKRHGIEVAAAEQHRLKPTFVAPAQVGFNAEAIAHVGSWLPGRVQELRVRLGDVVNKGDVLLVVESPELGEAQSEFLQKRIIAQTGVSTVELAKSGLDRASRLYDLNKSIPLDEVQKRELEFKSAQALQLAAQSAALAAENKLHLMGMDQAAVQQLEESGEVNPRMNILAPLAGRVVEREVTLGELVSPEKEALIVLADTTTLWVLADVPDARLHEVSLGAASWIRSDTLSGHKHPGQVSYISPMVDPRTRSAQVRVAVQCEHGTLCPGMFVQVEITATNPADPDPAPRVAVPEDAIQTVEGLPSVFVPVPGESNTFSPRPVVLGKPVAGMVPVYSGLAEGESFVKGGTFILKAELGKGAAAHEH